MKPQMITTQVAKLEPLPSLERRSPESIEARKVSDLIFRNELSAAIRGLNETQSHRLHELFNHCRYDDAAAYMFDELNILKSRKDKP